jgi:hypothetical protein
LLARATSTPKVSMGWVIARVPDVNLH